MFGFGIFFAVIAGLVTLTSVGNSKLPGGARVLNLIIHGGMAAWIILAALELHQ